jgi:outer membrane lipoprotein-sorting protein
MFKLLFAALTLQSAPLQPETGSHPAPDTEVPVTEALFDTDAALAGINSTLDAMTTMRARFIQTAPDGSSAQGLLSLSRPGRLRFEYDDPTPVLIIADGTTVAVEDTDLETVDRAPLRSTPLWWLLKANTNLAEDAEIVSMFHEFGSVYLTLEDPSDEMQGQIIFVFTDDDYQLIEWFVTDGLGQNTRVQLIDTEFDLRLSPRLFVIEEPENARDSRRGRR